MFIIATNDCLSSKSDKVANSVSLEVFYLIPLYINAINFFLNPWLDN